jgi:hypothetical protein
MYVTLAIPISPCRGLVLSTITGVDCFDVHQCPQSDCDCPLQSHPEFSRIRSATPITKHALSLSLSVYRTNEIHTRKSINCSQEASLQ